ncbi:MAG: DUF4149 domain-containing protein [Sulfurovum sp.]|nr:DUF4149 domain-containing protein [Sulfurovum sp.]
MKKIFRIATIVYLILLTATLGAGLFAGIVVAPVTFNTENWLGSTVLTHFQEGQIMTENFIRLSYLVNVTVVAIFLYEAFKYKMQERDSITILAAVITISSGLFFGHYYVPEIITMQLAGEAMTQSETFAAIHRASEIDFKIFSVTLLVLIIQNMRKACR